MFYGQETDFTEAEVVIAENYRVYLRHKCISIIQWLVRNIKLQSVISEFYRYLYVDFLQQFDPYMVALTH